MSTLVFALALFGCSDDATLCERLSDQAQGFKTSAQCELSIEQAFETDLVQYADFPTIIARCMPKSELSKMGGRPLDLSRPVIRFAARN
ncbi:MAG: hypothetical protein P8J20_14440 [Novosphingobium sp.]|nr:hypothetical protein [Novosphingobium sp.]